MDVEGGGRLMDTGVAMGTQNLADVHASGG